MNDLPIDMNTLTFIEALNVIDDAYCVVVNDSELLYPTVDIEEETIRIDSEHGDPIYINAKNNDIVRMTNSNIIVLSFVDENGRIVELTPLVTTKIKA